MENNKSLLWPQGILIALLALGATLSVGVMMLIKPNTSEAQSSQIINDNSHLVAKVGTQKRIESLKAAMLTSWQQEAQAKGLGYALAARFQGATIKEAKLSPAQKVIALTFDDGPWPQSTTQVLDILKQNNIKATFFVVGNNVKNYPDLLKRVNIEGHAIGNHTWHHWYHFMNQQAAAYEIDHTTDLIYKTTGVKTNLFRPPGGIMHNGVAAYARNRKYAVVMWSSDSVDYSQPVVPKLVDNVFRLAKPGGIVLMHDGGGNRSRTVQALPEIVARFRKQGYRFVTIPELLEMQDKEQSLIAHKK
ncbi:polysaccharide deacetylase family protein [Nostoc sp. FACHB-152]|uniref:polysaccharide deacetylase family protein n=1 Tax=unclassified Nostoc TaxID=2593658 RepID=UPI0016857B23|nr:MULTISPECIES: polysaccharide deacetylase family protein [unclassified Nostoc]MBD2451521.1 polysaccharide deacetylase family protein [Nostoc sp. FACHB-152]MBD2468615.1 polysaccharide deacetylase family protein [Nostoc sp. FACHB-145]